MQIEGWHETEDKREIQRFLTQSVGLRGPEPSFPGGTTEDMLFVRE